MEILREVCGFLGIHTINWERGSGGAQSTGVSQSVRETGRDESPSVPFPEKLFKIRDFELPNV